ncbi:MAG: phosphoribosylaminoimidazolecarboxamide formyltransferase [Bacillota bacterium]
MQEREIVLKYGLNPHQKPARIYSPSGMLPMEFLNGNPGYINLLDALNSWQLVKELRQTLGMPAAASFKHVSPAGAAIGVPLSDSLKKAYLVENMELSPLATAYVRARGADRMSSFGDWAALSDTVDESTAEILKNEVSDGIIAPGFTPGALEILKTKKKGAYNIVRIDPCYEPGELETRTVYGITFEQKRNTRIPGFGDLQNLVTIKKEIPGPARRDLLLAMITLKYTQSNSVCYVLDGQVTGVGAGQQSRIHCTRLAGDKADLWFLRQHPKVLGLRFREGVGRPARDNAIDQYLREDITEEERKGWSRIFEAVPGKLAKKEKQAWLAKQAGASLASDAFFPFRDNIDRAYVSGVRYIVQPGGSIRDEEVIQACDDYGIAMAFSNLRLFHH